MECVTVEKMTESMIADIPAEEDGVVEIDGFDHDRIMQSSNGSATAIVVAQITASEIAKALTAENEELAAVIKEAMTNAIEEAKTRMTLKDITESKILSDEEKEVKIKMFIGDNAIVAPEKETKIATISEAEARQKAKSILEKIATGTNGAEATIGITEAELVHETVAIATIEAVIKTKELAATLTEVITEATAAKNETTTAIATAIEEAMLEAAIVMIIGEATVSPNAKDEIAVAVTRAKLKAKTDVSRMLEIIKVMARAIAKLIIINPQNVEDVKNAIEEAEAARNEIEKREKEGEEHYILIGGKIPYMLVHLGKLNVTQAYFVCEEVSQRHLNDKDPPDYPCTIMSLSLLLEDLRGERPAKLDAEIDWASIREGNGIFGRNFEATVRKISHGDEIRWLHDSINSNHCTARDKEAMLMRLRLFLERQALSLNPIQQKIMGICVHFANRARDLEGFGHNNIENKYEAMMSYGAKPDSSNELAVHNAQPGIENRILLPARDGDLLVAGDETSTKTLLTALRKGKEIDLNAVIRALFERYPEARTFDSRRLLLYLQNVAKKQGVEITVGDSRIRQLPVWTENASHRRSGKTQYRKEMGDAVDEDAPNVNDPDYEVDDN